jgi:hypothetical protein
LSSTRVDASIFFSHFRHKLIAEREFWSSDDCAPEFRRCALATHGSALAARRRAFSTFTAATVYG